MFEKASRVAIHIDDPVVSQAAHYIVESESQWTLCRNAATADIRITGLVVPPTSPDDATTILVTFPQPALSRKAIDAFTAGAVNGVVASDELDQLTEAISVVAAGLAPVSLRVRDAAESMPRLSERQVAVVRELAIGTSYAAIATRLNVSESTVKREVQDLCVMFKATSRTTLSTAAAAAGLISVASVTASVQQSDL